MNRMIMDINCLESELLGVILESVQEYRQDWSQTESFPHLAV